MKITKSDLRRLIKEELAEALGPGESDLNREPTPTGGYADPNAPNPGDSTQLAGGRWGDASNRTYPGGFPMGTATARFNEVIDLANNAGDLYPEGQGPDAEVAWGEGLRKLGESLKSMGEEMIASPGRAWVDAVWELAKLDRQDR